MPNFEKSARRVEEKMRILMSLIQGGKISKEKKIELQIEYSFLQREYELYYNRRGKK
tara:strand:- start:280 stop:450 length:171 start_codon:yes stop_codon:yes gene_type:complete